MKKLISIIAFILIICASTNLFAITYLKFWVNGVLSNTITQGDMLAWEMDVATPGNTVTIELHLDLDGSQTISGNDLLLDRFQIQDGNVSGDGPSDSSATPDGIIYVDFGPFGFAPQNYVMKVTDEDGSNVTNWFTMNPILTPPATISGKVSIEGVTTPDSLYENIMIGAFGIGLFTGLTDNNGLYIINLSAADSAWSVEIFSSNTVSGFVAQDTTYQIVALAGNTDSINFYYKKPHAWVYGDLKDENGVILDLQTYIGLENETNGSESYVLLENGHYNLPATIEIQGNDSTNYFNLYVDPDLLIPTYLIPRDEEPFPLSVGDSLEKNLIAFTADTFIYGYVTEEAGPPSQSYWFYAFSDTFGLTEVHSDPITGYFELSVRTGSDYRVGLQDDPEWGTPLPPGYIISGGNWRSANPGDTLYFDLVAAGNLLEGSISFDPGDPTDFNFDHNRISAFDTSWNNYGTRVDTSLHFELPVPDGIYNVNFDPEVNNYLTMPAEYQFISVSQDTVDTLNFLLNYGHAHLTVKLTGAPIPGWFNGYGLNTLGNWPNVYSVWEEWQPDSTFHFNICEGDWWLNIPFDDQNYTVTPQDTTLLVTDNDSSFYVEFVYTLNTGVEDKKNIPTKFYLNQNFPNPFNPATTIEYGLSKAGRVNLTIYNILGEKVKTVVDEFQKAGHYRFTWQPANLASGIYIYKINSGSFNKTKKLILLR